MAAFHGPASARHSTSADPGTASVTLIASSAEFSKASSGRGLIHLTGSRARSAARNALASGSVTPSGSSGQEPWPAHVAPPVLVDPNGLGHSPVSWRIASTWAWDRLASAASMRATTPEMCGAAMLVPLLVPWVPPGTVE